MATYLNMNGTNGYLQLPVMTHTKIEVYAVHEFKTSSLQYVFSTDYQIYSITSSGADDIYTTSHPVNIGGVNVVDNATTKMPNGKKTTITMTYNTAVTTATDVWGRVGNASISKGKIFWIKVYNGASVVAHYNFDTGTLLDQSGNGNHITYAPSTTFIAENIINISSVADLQLVRNTPSGMFKLTKDIDMSGTTYFNYILDIDFSGEFDGNGFSFTDIDVYNTSSTSNYAFFNTVSGLVQNLGFKYKRANIYYAVSNTIVSPTLALVAMNVSGTLSKVSATCEDSMRAVRNHGLVGYLQSGALLQDTYFQTPAMLSGYNSNNYGETYIRVWGQTPSSVSNIAVRRNVAHVASYTKGSAPFVSAVLIGHGSSSSNVSGLISTDNVFYTDSTADMWIHSGIITTASVSDFQNPNAYWYANYDKVNTWNIESGKMPFLRVFFKVLTKIEQRAIQAYARVMSSRTARMVSSFKSIKAFTKAFASVGNRTVVTTKEMLSHTLGSVSSVLKKQKGSKVSTTYIEEIFAQSMTVKLRKVLLEVISFMEASVSQASSMKRVGKKGTAFVKKSVSKVSELKRGLKVGKGFTRKMNSDVKKYRGVIRVSSVSFIREMSSTAKRLIKKRLKIKSFSGKITTLSLSAYRTRMIQVVTSYSSPMFARMKRFSNIYQFAKKIVNSHSTVILSSVERRAFTKRIVSAYIKTIHSVSKSFYRVAQLVNVMAVVRHRFSQTRLFKRENQTELDVRKHRTTINKKDDGGEG